MLDTSKVSRCSGILCLWHFLTCEVQNTLKMPYSPHQRQTSVRNFTRTHVLWNFASTTFARKILNIVSVLPNRSGEWNLCRKCGITWTERMGFTMKSFQLPSCATHAVLQWAHVSCEWLLTKHWSLFDSRQKLVALHIRFRLLPHLQFAWVYGLSMCVCVHDDDTRVVRFTRSFFLWQVPFTILVYCWCGKANFAPLWPILTHSRKVNFCVVRVNPVDIDQSSMVLWFVVFYSFPFHLSLYLAFMWQCNVYTPTATLNDSSVL